jgi:hypothetical protein
MEEDIQVTEDMMGNGVGLGMIFVIVRRGFSFDFILL